MPWKVSQGPSPENEVSFGLEPCTILQLSAPGLLVSNKDSDSKLASGVLKNHLGSFSSSSVPVLLMTG